MSFQAERISTLSTYHRVASDKNSVRMDLNENYSEECPGFAVPEISIRKYPDEWPLTEALAEAWGLGTGNLLLFNGASEAIMCTALATVNSGDLTAVVKPEFFLIPHYLKLAGGELVEIPLTDGLEFNPGRIEQCLLNGVKVFFTSIPHNPSGAILSEELILEWCRKWQDTLFIIDEAYASFAGKSLLSQAQSMTNLLVIRSFSKDTALAGLRLGAASGNSRLMDSLKKVRTPYSVNAAALQAALLSIPYMARRTHTSLKRDLEILLKETEKVGLTVRKGWGNFFLILGSNSGRFCNHCRTRGVILRKLNSGAVRVSPSDRAGNEKYLECLADWRIEND